MINAIIARSGQKNQIIQGRGKMAEATRRGVIPNQMADIVKES
jgi:hypothetical protein